MLNQDKMPGAGSVADTIDFMKQIWSSMGAPSMATPSLSVEDINKKISDLKTVASWLELNLNMLKATIQTLEVQSATLSTLQAMSAIMASRDEGTGAAAAGASASASVPPFPFGFPMWPGAQPAAEAAADEPVAEEAQAEEEPELPPEDPPANAESVGSNDDPVPSGAADFQSAIANPNAWWNVLQEQFKHAVGNAMAGVKAEEEPLLKPVKPSSTVAKSAKRSKNKTVKSMSVKTRTVVPKAPKAVKAKPASVSRAVKGAAGTGKSAVAKPHAGKVPKTAANTSAPARTAVVQSRQNKKPASRKPTST